MRVSNARVHKSRRVFSTRLNAVATESAVSTKKRHSLRVLFVDDEQSIADLMRSELPRLGHNATVRQSPGSAIEAIQKSQADNVVWDPLRDCTGDDLNKDAAMAETLRSIRTITRTGDPRRTPLVIHHAGEGTPGQCVFPD